MCMKMNKYENQQQQNTNKTLRDHSAAENRMKQQNENELN